VTLPLRNLAFAHVAPQPLLVGKLQAHFGRCGGRR